MTSKSLRPKLKSNTQSPPENTNVHHSLLSPLLLATSLLVLPLTASIAQSAPNIFSPAAVAYLFITATDSNQVTAVDPVTGQVAQYIPVGTHPIRIAMRPDGARAFVSN